MKVILDGKDNGRTKFDIEFIKKEAIKVYEDEAHMWDGRRDLGRIAKLSIKPNLVRITTTLKHTIEYRED